ncbi:ATP-dependent DNA ligase [Paraburkholderia fungorum]|uniref:ATP-dependent DNA ligase n=1 Tax=Paraburkholderia fungorum TaxID=134537 RepID=UPI00402BB051
MLPIINAPDLMLATLGRAPFSREGWIFEIKYDGYRSLVRKTNDLVELVSRNGKNMNGSFPDIVASIQAIPGSFVWDAELTVDEQNGRSSFELLQWRARNRTPIAVQAAAKKHPARLYVFDMLASGRHDIRRMRLIERKAKLRESFESTSVIVHASGIAQHGELAFEHAAKLDLEGLMAKNLDSTYEAGRTREWLKMKNPKYSRPAALGWGRR